MKSARSSETQRREVVEPQQRDPFERRTINVRVELLAGCTTFLTMAYIIFVQPAMLSGAMFGERTGMDAGAVTFATCVSAAFATLFMGLYARYPIALAPGMGINAFFVTALLPAIAGTGAEAPWRIALGVVFVSGFFFLLMTFLGVRERIFNSVSPSLKNATAVGIGFFIAFIGLRNGGLIRPSPATYVTLNHDVFSPDLLIFLFGMGVTAILHCRRNVGAILWGILASTAVSFLLFHTLADSDSSSIRDSALMKQFQPATGVLSLPPSPLPTLFQLDLAGVFTTAVFPFVLVFLFVDLFDTIGTLIGVSEQAGFIKDNKLPRAGRALTADALGTVAGAVLGTSTVTSYIESASGIQAGGRTWLTSTVVAALFLLALFLAPVIAMVGSYATITAPALVLVGALMMRNARRIDWQDPTESIPAFLIVIGIPLTYSIGDGLALGFLAYPVLKVTTGRAKDVTPTAYVLSALLVLYFVFVRASL